MKIKILYFFVLVWIIIAGFKIINFIKIDDCLDGGNVWDYKRDVCITHSLTHEEIECYSQHGTWNSYLNTCER